MALSAAAHVVAVGVLMWMAYTGALQPSQEAAPDTAATRIVWVPMAGPNGGGGGRRVPARPQPLPDPPQAARTPDATAPALVITPLQPAQLQDTAEPQPLLPVNLFRPGTRGGEPVPVLVSFEIAFNIR